MNKILSKYLLLVASVLISTIIWAENNWDKSINADLPLILEKHREFVSIPNVSAIKADMYKNVDFIKPEFERLGFNVHLLESSSLPVFYAEKTVDAKAKTILFYFHLDGQPVNPDNWDQEDPFTPVIKGQNKKGDWELIDWHDINKKIEPEWRIFGRAAADDKGPITMMLSAMKLLKDEGTALAYNVKIILDLQEEAGSQGFLSTLEKYKDKYAADYMIIMDGPAHSTNKPTLTFGARGVAWFSMTVYGAKLPQHSGHYGNYAPNPVFSMSHLLASMKNENGRVTIDGYYDGIKMTPGIKALLENVPDNEEEIQKGLGINKADDVGNSYQESLQYPSLNVRHIETSWKGPGVKTVIPEFVTAHIDVRLVAETDGAQQLQKIKNHIQKQGYLLLDREPNDEERLRHSKIVKFEGHPGVNAFRTDMNAPIGQKLISSLQKYYGEKPVTIRTMGGTVPIVPAINTLKIPAVIVPMVNIDNNQHNPNENLRIGNIIQGIKMCMIILTMKLD
ncbi:MAG: acetylornithine deacetylase/succinyl-diaminopimelate desuccinylase-like protein [Gammaproteobacteria bacterium]|jgi:acetylornithine deacetylase/succinyl-diaminopimelate desuccinylase-like protein